MPDTHRLELRSKPEIDRQYETRSSMLLNERGATFGHRESGSQGKRGDAHAEVFRGLADKLTVEPTIVFDKATQDAARSAP